jgi:hypothetical protein
MVDDLHYLKIIFIFFFFFNKYDFFLTVTLAVFWLSGSAAWANGLNGLKGTTEGIVHTTQCKDVCKGVMTGRFSELTISVVSHGFVLCIICIIANQISFYRPMFCEFYFHCPAERE